MVTQGKGGGMKEAKPESRERVDQALEQQPLAPSKRPKLQAKKAQPATKGQEAQQQAQAHQEAQVGTRASRRVQQQREKGGANPPLMD